MEPLQLVVWGELGAVYYFVRPSNNRIPAKEFLDQCQESDKKKFIKGSFDRFTKMGVDYEIPNRFKPLHDDAKPLWEFKEHAPHIYAAREIFTLGEGDAKKQIAVAVLLNGWKKEKNGKAREETARIATAMTLYREYLGTGGKENNGKWEAMGTATERARRSRS